MTARDWIHGTEHGERGEPAAGTDGERPDAPTICANDRVATLPPVSAIGAIVGSETGSLPSIASHEIAMAYAEGALAIPTGPTSERCCFPRGPTLPGPELRPKPVPSPCLSGAVRDQVGGRGNERMRSQA
jgi:hypothetical protein